MTPTDTQSHMTMTSKELPKIPRSEVAKFVASKKNALAYPHIHMTMKAWLDSGNTPTPCYNIRWGK